MIVQPEADEEHLLERLYGQYRQPIVNYLYRMVGDRDQAEELMQDVFLRAFRALPGLPADANLRAWLYRIATNAAYDVLRRRRLIRWFALRDTDVDQRGEISLEQPGTQRAIQRALMALPDIYRSTLVLFSVQGYSIREISESLGISEGAVRTRLSRARELFRKAYSDET